MLVVGARAELLFGEPEVLVKAKHLVDDHAVRVVEVAGPMGFFASDNGVLGWGGSYPAQRRKVDAKIAERVWVGERVGVSCGGRGGVDLLTILAGCARWMG